jgi:predicted restriction endonuclease
LCECGQSKTIKSNCCNKCSNSKRIKFHTLKDTAHSVVHGQSAKFNIIRGRARNQHKHIKACQFCGYDKHVEVCHIKSISSFDLSTTIREINDLSNLIYLCPNCHWELDKGILKLNGR